MSGCFLPAVALLERGLIDVEGVVEETEGLRLLHYASYFGKAKALRVLCEVYGADKTSKDFRGQTPLHVAASCGELAALSYLAD